MVQTEVLSIENASVEFTAGPSVFKAVDGVSLKIEAGTTLGLVGESGFGKTTLAKSILGLQALSTGSINVDGKSVQEWGDKSLEHLGMVWQDPYASLNPRWTIKRSIEEPFRLGGKVPNVQEILQLVGLDGSYASRYPHELSGGQRQRVAIGRAIALRPSLIICDEPTAALDLSIRAQILNLLKDLQRESNTSYLFISHDLSTVRFIADYVAVMYLGNIVEEGPTEELFSSPKHPYTKALLDSAPSLDRLMFLPDPLQGEIPDPRAQVMGCKFNPRCGYATQECLGSFPPSTIIGKSRVSCFHPLGGAELVANSSTRGDR